MKVSLTVAVPGDMEGQKIPITLSEFIIGRDPDCHLCPGSPRVGKRHCALQLRKQKVFLKNFDSITGTYVNDRKVDGEVQLLDGDWLKIGPLLFRLNIEAAQARPYVPEDVIAELLLLDVPVLENSAAADQGNNAGPTAEAVKPTAAENAPAKLPSPAARAILDKYRRRGRG